MYSKKKLYKMEELWEYCYYKWYYNLAILHYKDICKNVDSDVIKWLNLAYIWNSFLKQWKIKSAYKMYEKAEKAYNLSEKIYDSIALALSNFWDYETALKYSDKSLYVSPWFSEGMLTKWEILNYLWEYEQAIIFFDKAIKRENEHENLFFWKAYAYQMLWIYNKALKNYDFLIKNINKNYKQAYNNKWLIFIKQWKIEKARKCYLQTLEIDSENETAKIQLKKINNDEI